MKWENNRQSSNIEDRRSQAGGGGLGGMFGGSGRSTPRRGGRGLSLGTIVIALIAAWIFGINPLTLLGGLAGGDLTTSTGTQQSTPGTTGQPADDMGQFVAAVLGGTEDAWGKIFQQGGAKYRAPTLVLFRGGHVHRLWLWSICNGAVLLPGRSEGLYRSVLL